MLHICQAGSRQRDRLQHGPGAVLEHHRPFRTHRRHRHLVRPWDPKVETLTMPTQHILLLVVGCISAHEIQQ